MKRFIKEDDKFTEGIWEIKNILISQMTNWNVIWIRTSNMFDLSGRTFIFYMERTIYGSHQGDQPHFWSIKYEDLDYLGTTTDITIDLPNLFMLYDDMKYCKYARK